MIHQVFANRILYWLDGVLEGENSTAMFFEEHPDVEMTNPFLVVKCDLINRMPQFDKSTLAVQDSTRVISIFTCKIQHGKCLNILKENNSFLI